MGLMTPDRPPVLPPPDSPRPARPRRAPLRAFVGGVLTSQMVNNALHLVQPLLIAELSGSLALAAALASAETGVHMLGTLVSGGPADRLGGKPTLVLATALRAAFLTLIPLAWYYGGLTLAWALCAYTLDAFVRGFIDTAIHTLPLELADGDRAELDRLNSTYEFTFDLGAIVGPLALGALLLSKQGFAAHAAIPAGFALSALLYSFVPADRSRSAARPRTAAPKWLDWEGWRHISADRRLLAPVLGLAAFNLFPLRKVWAAFFAQAILGQAAAVGWVGAGFGVGGVAGAAIYRLTGRRLSTGSWVAIGSLGTAALAVGWIPGRLWPMLASAAVFGLCNATAELALLRDLGEITPRGLTGRVISVARVGTASASVSLKALMAAAFGIGAGAFAAFGFVGAGLGVLTLFQLQVARKLRVPAAPGA